MKKLLDSKWGKFVIVAACFCIGGILCTVISLFAPAKVEEPTLAEKMYKSYSTTIEKKFDDGTIVKHIVNGDPFFHGHYPFSEPMDISALNYDTDNWIYRITYCCGTNEEIVFCIGDLWYTFEGGVYTMGNMPYITAAIGGVFDRMNGTEYPTEDVTEATTEVPTNAPTQAATQAQTEKFTIFVYDGEITDLGSDVDTSKLVENCLYLSNMETNTLTKLTEPVLQYHVSESRIDYIYKWEADRVYYVLESEPTRVYCIDLLNEAQNLVYESQNGDVMFVDWYNKEAHDKLILIEDSKRVIMLDLLMDEKKLLMEQYRVWHVTYTPDSLDYGGEDKGPTLKWAGAVSADDTWERGYVYHILTGENWKATWG